MKVSKCSNSKASRLNDANSSRNKSRNNFKQAMKIFSSSTWIFGKMINWVLSDCVNLTLCEVWGGFFSPLAANPPRRTFFIVHVDIKHVKSPRDLRCHTAYPQHTHTSERANEKIICLNFEETECAREGEKIPIVSRVLCNLKLARCLYEDGTATKTWKKFSLLLLFLMCFSSCDRIKRPREEHENSVEDSSRVHHHKYK